MTTTTALVVDDHPLFRAGLCALLEELDVEVVGECADGEEVLAAVRRLRPDVVFMDLSMPRLDGVSATRRLLEAEPTARVLVLTMRDDDATVAAALGAGALGYVLKGAGLAEVARAVDAVRSGAGLLSPSVAARMRTLFSSGAAVPPLPELTHRERDVLRLVAEGLPIAAVAARLSLSDKTVRNYLSTAYAKLGVTNRSAAVARAHAAGLVVHPADPGPLSDPA